MKNVVTFDDTYLVPGYSEVASRHDVDLRPNIMSTFSQMFSNPLIAAPMDTVVNANVAEIMAKSGGSAVLHRYVSIEKQVEEYLRIPSENRRVIFCAVGAVGDFFERFQALYDVGCRLFCVDVAHGHHKNVAIAMQKMRADKDDIDIMSGNVASVEGYNFLVDNGATFVRVGVSGGAACTTRNKTGFGLPTLQSVIDCATSNRNGIIVADGGFRDSGDIVKALACGADMVMLGSMLSGHKESPGDVVYIDGIHYKVFRGMASESAQKAWRGKVSVEEGKEILVPLKEKKLIETVNSILGGIKSGISYAGSSDLKSFYEDVKIKFV
jgi:IMP dehydrogenase